MKPRDLNALTAARATVFASSSVGEKLILDCRLRRGLSCAVARLAALDEWEAGPVKGVGVRFDGMMRLDSGDA